MSKIEVDAITEQSGTTLTAGGGAGKTVVVDATTVTLGRCGGTVALASGASQTGFGRTGTVDWQTGSIKTATFTAANGEGYFCDTSGGAFTVNLPAGSAGAIVSFADYTRTFQTEALTLNPNGSEKIGGIAEDAILTTEGQTATFVYVDATEGWINTQETSNSITGAPPYITATGGNSTVTSSCGNFKTHIFTGPGTFQVTAAGAPSGADKLDYVIIAGGGGGGGDGGGGGGAGGFRLANSYSIPAPTMSPLSNPTAVTASVGSFPIVIGGGGTAGTYSPTTAGTPGVASSGLGLTSAGGGAGGLGAPGCAGENGGSGGGGTRSQPNGTGNTPPVSPPQGNPGGNGPTPNGDGGGGAGAPGSGSTSNNGGIGGAGDFIADAYFGPGAPSYGEPGPVSSTRYLAGGGGGGGDQNPSSGAVGGVGGGGDGGNRPNSTPGSGGTINTGSGGGGGGVPGNAGAGGSGIVMIRYKFQN